MIGFGADRLPALITSRVWREEFSNRGPGGSSFRPRPHNGLTLNSIESGVVLAGLVV
jgi:hypothetical protein